MGAAAAELDYLMNPLASKSFKYSLRSICSFKERLCKPPNGASQPAFNSIAMSNGIWGGNTATCGEKTCNYLLQIFSREGESI